MEWSTITSAVSDVPLVYFLLAIMLNSIIAVFGAFSYKLLFFIQKEKLSFFNSFFVLHILEFVKFLTPFKMGALVGKPLITRLIGGISLKNAVFAVGFENFFSITWQIALLPILLLLVGENILFNNMLLKIALIIFFVVLLGIVSYKYKWFLPKIIGLKKYIPEKIKRKAAKAGLNEEMVNDFLLNVPSYFNSKRLILLLGLLTIAQALLLPLFIGLSLAFFDVEMSYFNMFAVYWISYVLGRFSFLPSGLGVKDVTMGGLLLSLGVNGLTVVKTIVLFRIFAFIPYVVVGGCLFLYYGHKYTYKKLFKKDISDDFNQKL